MSIAYNNRKKAKKRQLQKDIVDMEFGNSPSLALQAQYPGKDDAYILAACKARWDYRMLIKRMIREGTVSRYVLAKDGKGRPLFRSFKKCRGIYKFSKTGERIIVGQYMIQKFIGHELQRQAEAKQSDKV